MGGGRNLGEAATGSRRKLETRGRAPARARTHTHTKKYTGEQGTETQRGRPRDWGGVKGRIEGFRIWVTEGEREGESSREEGGEERQMGENRQKERH